MLWEQKYIVLYAIKYSRFFIMQFLNFVQASYFLL